MPVRRKAWPYLLEVIPWDADHIERTKVWSDRRRVTRKGACIKKTDLNDHGTFRTQYENIKKEWNGVEEVFNRDDVVEVRLAAYSCWSRSLMTWLPQQERHRIDVDCRRTDRTQPIFSNPSPPKTSSSFSRIVTDDDGGSSQSQSNDHVDKLAEILLSYNFYEKELGMWRGTRAAGVHFGLVKKY